MPNTLIIGYGNALRGDDGAGYIAAELLRERIHDPNVEVFSLQQLTPELMEPVSRASQVIFMDASVVGPGGEVQPRPAAAGSGLLALHPPGNSGDAARRRASAVRPHARGRALHDPGQVLRCRPGTDALGAPCGGGPGRGVGRAVGRVGGEGGWWGSVTLRTVPGPAKLRQHET